jgi:chromosome segregation ATPase
MSRLELAADRLNGALESLESAIAPLAPEAEGGAKRQGRIADLEAERECLLTRIAGLEEELAAMASVTEDVEERLDGAIDEIRTALGR